VAIYACNLSKIEIYIVCAMEYYITKMTVKLNVSGQLFETYDHILLKIPYFADMLEVCPYDGTTIFVARPSHVFKHVLALATDSKYPYPSKYAYELDFYGITYDTGKLYASDTNTKLDNLISAHRKCRDYTCTNLAKPDDLHCKNHNKCYENGCNNTVSGTNYCKDHYNNGVICDMGGCSYYRWLDKKYCFKHFK
jgi:hypothetical protein